MRLSLVLLARGYYTSHSKKIKKEIAIELATQYYIVCICTRFMNCMSVCRYDTIPSRVWPTALSNAQTPWPAAAARISGGAPAAAHRVKEFKTASSSQGVIFMIMALVRTVVSLLKICPASYSATQNILLWCRFCADETKQKHLVIFFSL